MSADYKHLSANVIRDLANDDVYLTRVDSASSIHHRLVDESVHAIVTSNVTVSIEDNKFYDAVKISFQPHSEKSSLWVDLVISDFGNYISDSY